jgi:hypothetical protein
MSVQIMGGNNLNHILNLKICFKFIFLNILNYFNVLILKIILKKYYFNIFLNKNYFKN